MTVMAGDEIDVLLVEDNADDAEFTLRALRRVQGARVFVDRGA